MSLFRIYRWAAAAVVLATALGCHSDPNSARGVAEQFVDQHYVQIDLPAAEKFCSGLALAKVRESIHLTEGVRIDDTTRKPIVHYRVTPRSESDDEASFVFDATVQVAGADTFEMRWIVLTQKVDGVWKVANFNEESS